jgi:aminoglycoside 6-adenylyltransferase
MRSEPEIKTLIINIATNDNRIRSVLLNGSRANPNIAPDRYQDFDIVFIVNNINSFTSNHDWTNVFGEVIIRQLPDEMTIGTPDSDGFGYLMLLKDGNRIDLTLYPFDKVHRNCWPDSLTVCWLDKDNLFPSLPLSNDSNYYIKRPSAKEFHDTCNEFWWVSTYVAKGLLRNEITYAKEMLEISVRPMFMKLIEWKIGSENEFSVSFGKAGKFMSRFLARDLYADVLKTYSDAEAENNWRALFKMTELFEQIAGEVSVRLNFQIDKSEQLNTIRYLRHSYVNQKTSGK